ncbi:DegT/DnrJ/EryC1/StrS family aminotransferase [Candidatus Purcelliella pentastirinorum]
MNKNLIEKVIISKTKVIVAIHYAGVNLNMYLIMFVVMKYNLYVIERR